MAYVVYDDAAKNAMVDSLLVQIEAGKSMREVCRMDGMRVYRVEIEVI